MPLMVLPCLLAVVNHTICLQSQPKLFDQKTLSSVHRLITPVLIFTRRPERPLTFSVHICIVATDVRLGCNESHIQA